MIRWRIRIFNLERHIPFSASKPSTPTRAWSTLHQMRKPAKLRSMPNFNPRTTSLLDLPQLHLLLHLPSHNSTCNIGINNLCQAPLRHSRSTPAAFLTATNELSAMLTIISFKHEKACAKIFSILELLILQPITWVNPVFLNLTRS